MADELLTTLNHLKTILPIVEKNITEKTIAAVSPKIIEPANDDIPMVFITGEIPTSKKYVQGEIEYKSKTNSFHAYTYIKLQGNSSLLYPKKNFTINLYANKDRNIKLNKEFKNWGAHNNFVLKADYIDILHARNVVSAKLWGKVVSSRADYDTLPDGLRSSPNNGATDGFPIKVFINGEYQGLYNWTIPKCDWMFGVDGKNSNHFVLCAETNDNGNTSYRYNPCNFNQPWSGIDGENWSIEVGEGNDSLTNNLNTLIEAVATSHMPLLDEVLDVQSAIDYFVFQDIILGTDGLAKNMILMKYDDLKWHLSAYDMDSTFDLGWQGQILNCYDADFNFVPPFNNKYSQLLALLLNEYPSEMRDRYIQLRNGVLSEQSIISEFEEYVGIFGEDLYIQDTITYPDIPSVTTNNLINLKRFILSHLSFLDSKYKYNVLRGGN